MLKLLKFVWFESVASVMRMIFIVPVLAIWIAISTLYVSGYDLWLSIAHDLLSDQETFQLAFIYLFSVSFLISVVFFMPSRIQCMLINHRSGSSKAYADYPLDTAMTVTGSSK